MVAVVSPSVETEERLFLSRLSMKLSTDMVSFYEVCELSDETSLD